MEEMVLHVDILGAGSADIMFKQGKSSFGTSIRF